MVEEWERVYCLNHNVLVMTHFLGHTQHDRAVGKCEQRTDGHLLRKVLILLDTHESQEDIYTVMFGLAQCFEVAHAVSWRLLQLLLFYEVLSLVVDLSQVALLEDKENVSHGRLLYAVDGTPLLRVDALRLKSQTRDILLLGVVNFLQGGSARQPNLRVDVSTALSHECSEITNDEAKGDQHHDSHLYARS